MQHIIENKFQNWYVDLLALAAFTLPLSKKLSVPVLAIVLVIAIIIKGFKVDFKIKFKNTTVLLFFAFFMLQIIAYWYSANSKAALFDIETKLSFLLVPIMIRTDLLGYEVIEKIKKAFIQGGVLAVFLNLSTSIYRYYNNGSIDSFFYGNFSSHIHTSYFSSYLILALSFILFSKKMRSQAMWWYAAGALMLGVILCLSRAGILVAGIVLVMFLLRMYVLGENRKAIRVISISLLSVVILSLALPKVRERLKNAFITKEQNDKSIQAATAYERISVWKTSVDLIKDNFLVGLGSGDVKDELVKEYNKRGMSFAAKYTLNAHNQYLQTTLANGIFGFFILIGILFYGFKKSLLDNDFVFISFSLIISIGFMFESMLETQAGIVFFAFFYQLFCLKSKES